VVFRAAHSLMTTCETWSPYTTAGETRSVAYADSDLKKAVGGSWPMQTRVLRCRRPIGEPAHVFSPPRWQRLLGVLLFCFAKPEDPKAFAERFGGSWWPRAAGGDPARAALALQHAVAGGAFDPSQSDERKVQQDGAGIFYRSDIHARLEA
jgi:hypothetical protein